MAMLLFFFHVKDLAWTTSCLGRLLFHPASWFGRFWRMCALAGDPNLIQVGRRFKNHGVRFYPRMLYIKDRLNIL